MRHKSKENGVEQLEKGVKVREYYLNDEVRKKAMSLLKEWEEQNKGFNEKLGLLILGFLSGNGVVIEEDDEVRMEPDVRTIRVLKKGKF